jgi:hypothetical protein
MILILNRNGKQKFQDWLDENVKNVYGIDAPDAFDKKVMEYIHLNDSGELINNIFELGTKFSASNKPELYFFELSDLEIIED